MQKMQKMQKLPGRDSTASHRAASCSGAMEAAPSRLNAPVILLRGILASLSLSRASAMVTAASFALLRFTMSSHDRASCSLARAFRSPPSVLPSSPLEPDPGSSLHIHRSLSSPPPSAPLIRMAARRTEAGRAARTITADVAGKPPCGLLKRHLACRVQRVPSGRSGKECLARINRRGFKIEVAGTARLRYMHSC